MATLERAIEIAAKAHSGQVDKAGEPYILHPIQVMLRVTGEEQRVVAILHDVLEDSDVSVEDLRIEGFSEPVLEALIALTKRDDETRIEAAWRARDNDIAREVKLADNKENMRLDRIPEPTEKDFERMKEYEEVREVLLGPKDTRFV